MMLRVTARRHLILRPFAEGTEEERGAERIRVATLSALTNIGSKGMSMLLMVLSVHFTIGYLGVERFGVWMTLSSLVAMLSFLDLGVGNSLTNITAKRATETGSAALQNAISSGLIIMAVCGAFVALLLFAAAQIVPWRLLFRIDEPAFAAEAQMAAEIFAIGFGVVLLAGGVQKVYLGLQRAVWSHLMSMLSTLVTIIALMTAAQHQAGVPVLLGIMLTGQSMAALPLIIGLWRQGLLKVRIPLQALRNEAPGILRSSGLFFVLQIGMMVGWGSDLLIVSATTGAALAAHFAITQRLFQFASVPLQIMSQPLWGAYADAHARGDWLFIRRMLQRSLVGIILLALAIVSILVIAHKPLIEIWSKGEIVLPISLVVTYGTWTVVEVGAVTLAMYLNGCSVIRPQIFSVIVFCALSIPMKILLAGQFGVTGIVATSILAWIVAVPLLLLIFFRREFLEPLKMRQND